MCIFVTSIYNWTDKVIIVTNIFVLSVNTFFDIFKERNITRSIILCKFCQFSFEININNFIV